MRASFERPKMKPALHFDVTVREGETVVAEVRVRRVLLDRQRFLARAFGD